MKRTLAIFLSILMLASCLSAFAFTASADSVTITDGTARAGGAVVRTQGLTVHAVPATGISDGTEWHKSDSNYRTPENMWVYDTSLEQLQLDNVSNDVYPTITVGEESIEVYGSRALLADPTCLTKFEVTFESASKGAKTWINGASLYASIDGITWDVLYTFSGITAATAGVQTYAVDSNSKFYNYVALYTSTANAGLCRLEMIIPYGYTASDALAADVVESYGQESTDRPFNTQEAIWENTAEVQYQDVNFTSPQTLTLTDETTAQGYGAAAQLQVPSKIRYFEVNRSTHNTAKNWGSYWADMTLYGSTDGGNTWAAIAHPTAVTTANTTTHHAFAVDAAYADTVFTHVAILTTTRFRVSQVVAYGIPEEPVKVGGYQLADDGENAFAIRFIGMAGILEASAVAESYGMTVKLATENGMAWRFTKTTDKLLSSFTEKSGETETVITAGSLDCQGFYTAVIENIPKDIGLFSVSVTPFVMIGGKKTTGETKTIVMENRTATGASKLSLKENIDRIKVSGRSFDVPEGIACDFAASGIEFNAVAAGELSITAECSATTYYTVYINGVRRLERLKMTAGTGEYTVATDLAVGNYNIKLVKQTHIGLSTSTLLSVTMNGRLTKKPADRDVLIEFVGDSITCGYGVVNYPTTGVTKYNTADYADASQAYAYQTAERLGADSSMIAVSGWTLSSVSTNNIPGIYGCTSFPRSQTVSYVPQRIADVVVINLGTNDIGSEDYAEKFIPEAKAFVAKVREMNPNAAVVFAYGMMMSGETLNRFEADIRTVVRDLGATGSGVFAVRLPTNQAAGNGHPSIEGHTVAAEILAKFIRENCF